MVIFFTLFCKKADGIIDIAKRMGYNVYVYCKYTKATTRKEIAK